MAAPTTALRYLGGWLSPSMRSRKGKRMLLAGIHSILNVLQYKKLEWREYRYVIQSVVASKALYLNVAPFTDAELDAIDRRIAGQFKKTLKLARSTSSHICYLPEADRGFALPSLKQRRRDALLVKQAYRCLNDPGHLGKLFRTRLLDLKLAIGHTNNPLSKPTSHRHLYNKYWFTRVAHILHETITLYPLQWT